MRSGIDLQMTQPQYEMRNYSIRDYEIDRSEQDKPVTEKSTSHRSAGYSLWMGLRNFTVTLISLPRHIAI